VIVRLEREIADLLATLSFDPLALLGDVLNAGTSLFRTAAVLLVVVLAGLYAALRPDPLRDGLLALFPRARRGRVGGLLNELGETLTRWLAGTAVAMVTVGAMVTLALWFLGSPFPLLFGVIAGLLEAVPFYGPALSAVPAVLVALSESWSDALAVLVAIVIIQQVESNVLIPLIMGKAVELHPTVIALGILFVGWTLGLLAIVVAVPILAVSRVLVRNLWTERLKEHDGADRAHHGPRSGPPTKGSTDAASVEVVGDPQKEEAPSCRHET
jgi:predicted PurR-regulated permease PerM